MIGQSSLRLRVAVFATLIAVIPLAALAFIAISQVRDAQIGSARIAMQQGANASAGQLQRMVSDRLNEITAIAQLQSIQGAVTSRKRIGDDEFARISKIFPYATAFAILDFRGGVIQRTSNFAVNSVIAAGRSSAIIATALGGGNGVSPFYKGADGTPYMYFASGVNVSGGTMGAVIVETNGGDLLSVVDEDGNDNGSFGVLFNGNGKAIHISQEKAPNFSSLEDVHLGPLAAAYTATGNAVVPVHSLDGKSTAFAAIAHVNGTDWAYAYVWPSKLFYGAVMRTQLIGAALAAAAGTAVFILAFVVLPRFTLRRVIEVSAAVEDAAEHHDLTRRLPVGISDEMGRLALAFNTLIARFKDAVVQVRRGGVAVEAAATELYSENEQLRLTFAEHAAVAEETAASVAQIAASAQQVVSTVGRLRTRADAGGKTLDDVVNAVELVSDNNDVLAATALESVSRPRRDWPPRFRRLSPRSAKSPKSLPNRKSASRNPAPASIK